MNARSILLASVGIFATASFAQTQGQDVPPPTAAQEFLQTLADAHEVSLGQMQFRATGGFLDGMGELFNIAPARIAEWMETAKIPGPVAYFNATVFPLANEVYKETIYFFDTEAWGTFYVRLGGPAGIQFGSWNILPVIDKLGRNDGCQRTIKLRGWAFFADFDFNLCSPLETIRTDYFCRSGLLGSVSLTPDC